MASTSFPVPFRPPWLWAGGHRQTILAALERPPATTYRAVATPLETRDGDWLVLHDDRPDRWQPGDPTLLLLHGLCGCHAAGYMIRWAERFTRAGVRTFRLDMRGCGAAFERSRQLTHAGRSDDVVDALDEIARQTRSGPLWALGVSMGGNQLLRACGRGDASEAKASSGSSSPGLQRLCRVAAIAPPIDLPCCSENMQRISLRPYNWYFIRALLRRVPPKVQASTEFRQLSLDRLPRTLRELDGRVTAPLGGFADVDDYYRTASSAPYLSQLRRPTLIVAAEDDPIVPVEMFRRRPLSEQVVTTITRRGGHAAYIARDRTRWLDETLMTWFQQAAVT